MFGVHFHLAITIALGMSFFLMEGSLLLVVMSVFKTDMTVKRSTLEDDANVGNHSNAQIVFETNSDAPPPEQNEQGVV